MLSSPTKDWVSLQMEEGLGLGRFTADGGSLGLGRFTVATGGRFTIVHQLMIMEFLKQFASIERLNWGAMGCLHLDLHLPVDRLVGSSSVFQFLETSWIRKDSLLLND
ncbi:hypothetical protein SO802_013215 [Lithocarpus litseifolius]|uniref:Uncharacterized protein n=1 Tax=Lithocarpus litseifolius TaxID=425828 RepID=A0AAW2D5V3_9ROSI